MLAYKSVLESVDSSSVLLCPSYPFLPLMHSRVYHLGAQDVSSYDDSYHTGEVCARQLHSLDVSGVLIGHTEIKDSFEKKVLKVKQTLKESMKAYILLSDSKQDFDYQYTSEKLLGQIRAYLSRVPASKYKDLVFVYEPSWLVALEETLPLHDVENIFFFMKEELKKEYSFSFPFYYGGGLCPKNFDAFYASPFIDGLMLGHMSFDPYQVISYLNK